MTGLKSRWDRVAVNILGERALALFGQASVKGLRHSVSEQDDGS